ncbi:hypothetical protein HDZ31DRAFT_32064 [Schizophyllum fasciatum]
MVPPRTTTTLPSALPCLHYGAPIQTPSSSKVLPEEDYRIDAIMALFEDARQRCPDILAGHPSLDLIAFAEKALYFAVVDGGVHEDALDSPSHQDWVRAMPDTPEKTNEALLGIVYLFPAGPESEARRKPVNMGHAGHSMDVSVEESAEPRIAPHLTIGIYLAPAFERLEPGLRFLQRALEPVLQRAFDDIQAHRVQVRLLDDADQFFMKVLFTGFGFKDEGTRRGAFYDPLAGHWRDETTLALCATDWVTRRRAPETMWEALIARHAREREDLLRHEQTHSYLLRRSSSTETIRMINDAAPSEVATREASRAPSRAASHDSARGCRASPNSDPPPALRYVGSALEDAKDGTRIERGGWNYIADDGRDVDSEGWGQHDGGWGQHDGNWGLALCDNDGGMSSASDDEAWSADASSIGSYDMMSDSSSE